MIHTDGKPTIAMRESELTASERIRAARAKADREGGFDIEAEDHGSIVLLKARTTAGQEWFDENLSGDVLYWGTSVVCEPRYVADVLAGAQADGLKVA